MSTNADRDRMAELAANLDESLRALSYPQYLEEIYLLIEELLDYYRYELTEDIVTLAVETLGLLNPAVSPEWLEVERIAKAWESINAEFHHRSRNVNYFCWTLSLVDVQLSGVNYSIGRAISNILISDICRPLAPSEMDLPFAGFSIPAEQIESDLRMLNRLIESVRRRGAN